MNSIKKSFVELKRYFDGEMLFEWMEKLEHSIKSNPGILPEVLEIFENETQDQWKILLAEILAKFNCKEIVPFLKKMLRAEDRNGGMQAAISLIYLENSSGIEFLKTLAQQSEWHGWEIYDELLEIQNDMAQKLAKEIRALLPPPKL